MKIAVYVGRNEPERSIYILGMDIVNGLRAIGQNAFIATKIQDCAKTDKVLNLLIEDVGGIEKSRRFTGCGEQTVLFSANPEEYIHEELLGHLVWVSRVKMIVHSEFMLDKVRELFSAFSPSFRLACEKNLSLIWGGVPKVEMELSNTSRRWMVPYNRWNEAQKNCTVHKEVTELALTMIAKRGMIRPEIYFNVMSDELVKEIREHSGHVYTVMKQPTTKEQYLEFATTVGMAICTSKYESLGLMYLELLSHGCVVVFLDRPWVRKLLPDYKLIASNKNDLAALTVQVYSEWERAHKYVLTETMPFIEKQRSFDAFVDGIDKILSK